ncbi:MAG: tyrosine-type recombinase/integrase [Bacteroidales bacterium]|nr:tyrosine-type recombinase/integrase [Bacteroidales bacterium]
MRICNYSHRTISTYLYLIELLSVYYGKPTDQLTTDQIKDYIYHRITTDNISVSAVNQIISAWKIIYVYILGNKWEGCQIKRPRREIKLPDILSEKKALELVDSPRNLKHRVILNLMYSTGIRRNELLSLKVEDVDSSRMLIKVRQGKGKKDRQVVLHTKVLKLLRDYYSYYRPKVYLFEGHKQGEPYSASSVNKLIKRNAINLGITKIVSAHTLRHCFATHMLEKGVNLKIIQQLMGHSSLKTTSRYLHFVKINKGSLPNPLD